MSNEEVIQLIKLTALYFRAGDRYSIDEFKNGICWVHVSIGSEEPTVTQEAFRADARLIDLQVHDGFYPIVLDFLIDGSLPEGVLSKMRDMRSAMREDEGYRTFHTRLWDLIHSTLEDTSEKFIDMALEFFTEYPNLPLSHAYRIISTVKELGANSDEFWGLWLSSENLSGLSENEIEQLTRVIPSEFKKRLPAIVGTATPTKIDPADVMDVLVVKREFPSDDLIGYLAQWSRDEWLDWLNTTKYTKALQGIEHMLSFQMVSDSAYVDLINSLKDALPIWADQSQINRIRFERYFSKYLTPESDIE